MVEEREILQALWNTACVAGGAAPYCANANQDNLSAAERTQLDTFLPRPLRTLEIDAWVLDTMLDMSFGNHKVTVGGQYQDAEMEDGVYGMYGDGFVRGASQPHEQWALFAEDNWSFGNGLTFTYGLRYDNHKVFGDHLSPRGYLVWDANDIWTFKGGVSTGYKTPKPNQLFPGVNGFFGQGATPQVGSPGLQPETSTNYELAAYYNNPDGYSFNATLFFSKFKDKIATSGEVPNCEVAAPGARCADIGVGWAELGYLVFMQEDNIDRAETEGVELAGSIQLPAGLALRGNYTYTKSENKTGDAKGQPIAGLTTSSISTPAKHMANATLDWAALDNLNLSLVVEGRYERYRGVSAATGEHLYYDNHTLLHLGGSWRTSGQVTVNLRINNLLDKNYMSQTCELLATQDAYSCFDDYLVKDQRRSFWGYVSFRF
jgi:outer membrane receptor for ferrienterochelin and colicins